MLDLKVLHATLDQLEEDKKIPREKIIEAIEQALAAAYKKDYGKRNQIIRCEFNTETGDTEFSQIKIVVDSTTVRPPVLEGEEEIVDDEDERVRYDEEKHIYLDDARRIKTSVSVGDEITFPLEASEDFGRIAAQTAKQVIIQRIREAVKGSILEEYQESRGTVVSGVVQKEERGNVLVDLGRAVAILPFDEKIPGEEFRTGQRIKAYLFSVEETPKGVNLKLSRSHPRLIESLFAIESPEVQAGTVEIKAIAREAGSRSKIAVVSYDENIDPIGACVGQKGIRVTTIMNELNGEKIDIIPWSEDPEEFIAASLSPSNVLGLEINDEEHIAHVKVAEDQLSLAIGKGGQNVRLAAKLTGWKIDITGVEGEFEGEADLFDDSEEIDLENVGDDIGDLVRAATGLSSDSENISKEKNEQIDEGKDDEEFEEKEVDDEATEDDGYEDK